MQHEFATTSEHTFTWLDLNDPAPEELNQVAQQYDLYYTVIKDCLEPDHLPKFESISGVNFIITRIYNPDKETDADTIQELSNLALANELDTYESALFLGKPAKQILQQLYYLKRKASSAKRILTLTEDILHCLQRVEGVSPVLQDTLDLHLKARTIYEQLEEAATHLLNIYLSMASQRTNEVMRVLTIFSAFFLPLTFIAGIYGMNFEHMPELKWPFGYPATLLGMLIIAGGIFVWFRRKGWI